MIRTTKSNGNGGIMIRLKVWRVKSRLNSYNRKTGTIYFGKWDKGGHFFYTEEQAEAYGEKLKSRPVPRGFDLTPEVEDYREFRVYRAQIPRRLRSLLGIEYWYEG